MKPKTKRKIERISMFLGQKKKEKEAALNRPLRGTSRTFYIKAVNSNKTIDIPK